MSIVERSDGIPVSVNALGLQLEQVANRVDESSRISGANLLREQVVQLKKAAESGIPASEPPNQDRTLG